MPLVEDVQRVEQLAAEEFAAPALIGQGRQRGDDREPAGDAAEIRLHPPQRDDEARLHAVARRNRLE
jgi:hypothetical protein